MRFIVMTCEGRELLLKAIKKELPEAEVCFDDFKRGRYKSTAWENFKKALRMSGNNAFVLIEDDAVLCPNFKQESEAEIRKTPNDFIQFFSMRNPDPNKNYESGSRFLMNQCFYIPSGFPFRLLKFCEDFEKKDKTNKHSPNDTAVAEFLKVNKMKYRVVTPNLVDHREIKSIIDPRRSSRRQSSSFFGHWYKDLPKYNSALGQRELKDKEIYSGVVKNRFITAFKNDISEGLPKEFSECDVFYTETSWKKGQDKFNKSAGEKVEWIDYIQGLKKLMKFRKPFIAVSSKDFEKYFFPAHQKFETELNGGRAYCFVYNTRIPEIGSSIRIIEYLSQVYDHAGDPSCGNGRTGFMFMKRGKRSTLTDYDSNCILNIKKWI